MATSLASSVPDVPHQPGPGFVFPSRSFGRKSTVHRSFQFQLSWFMKWPFLHYNEGTDTVFCHACLSMFKQRKSLTSTKADQTFVCTTEYCTELF